MIWNSFGYVFLPSFLVRPAFLFFFSPLPNPLTWPSRALFIRPSFPFHGFHLLFALLGHKQPVADVCRGYWFLHGARQCRIHASTRPDLLATTKYIYRRYIGTSCLSSSVRSCTSLSLSPPLPRSLCTGTGSPLRPLCSRLYVHANTESVRGSRNAKRNASTRRVFHVGGS